jgi:hypothetical protein
MRAAITARTKSPAIAAPAIAPIGTCEELLLPEVDELELLVPVELEPVFVVEEPPLPVVVVPAAVPVALAVEPAATVPVI